MGNEGAKVGLSAAEVAALIAAHAADYTKHAKVIRKTADQTVNNSDELQDDDELFLPLGANEVWAFILLLIENSSETADIITGFAVPSGAVYTGWVTLRDINDQLEGRPFATEDTISMSGVGVAQIPGLFTGIVINGATAGNLQFQWSQYIPEESDTKVLANSLLLAWKLA